MPKMRVKHSLLTMAAAMLVGLMAIAATSCNSDGCTTGVTSLPLAVFYSAETQKTIAVDSISVYGVDAPGDSMLVRCGRNVSRVYLPLRISQSEVQYVFHYDQTAICNPLLNDTLTISYDAVPYFESADCGVFYIFDVNNYTHTKHIIDSVSIPYNRISNMDVETVRIFFRTQSES
ncbi:MAG: DUF6452 family protein [Muribaculaceae bacterium]